MMRSRTCTSSALTTSSRTTKCRTHHEVPLSHGSSYLYTAAYICLTRSLLVQWLCASGDDFLHLADEPPHRQIIIVHLEVPVLPHRLQCTLYIMRHRKSRSTHTPSLRVHVNGGTAKETGKKKKRKNCADSESTLYMRME
eukprot:1158831-Pelagomonas_calceolata.AAC.6